MYSYTNHQYTIARINRLMTYLFSAFLVKAEVPATPVILLNGYRLPDLYQLPDLKYMLQ